MGKRTKVYVRRYWPLFKVLLIAALNGAVTGIGGLLVLPEFAWKHETIVASVMISTGKAIIFLLTDSPIKAPERRRRVR